MLRSYLALSLLFPLIALAQQSAKPLSSSELLALVAGGNSRGSIVYEIRSRGVQFLVDEEYRNRLKAAGADDAIVSALSSAQVNHPNGTSPNTDLVKQLSKAVGYIKTAQYSEAVNELSLAMKSSFGAPEAEFVAGELLVSQQQWPQAAGVYHDLLTKNAGFPGAHTKYGFVLYRMGELNEALMEAKAGIAANPSDADAHKIAGLVLDDLQKPEAAALEYDEALRIQPDSTLVHYDLGLHYQRLSEFDKAISEYKKSIALKPDFADAHTNLGNTYGEKGDLDSAIQEQREAKRLSPNDPDIRQNLASALMRRDPRAAVVELREMEKQFPDFPLCHLCLANGLAWEGESNAAEAEYLKTAELDPSNPEPYMGLGKIREDAKDYDGALTQYRAAGRLSGGDPRVHKAIGRVLLAKQDMAAAVQELARAESLSPADADAHILYAQALLGMGKSDQAVTELKAAASLDPTSYMAIVTLGTALEKKGDWLGAMTQYRRAAIAEAELNRHHSPGTTFLYSERAQKEYKAAQGRLADRLRLMRSEGKSAEAGEVEKQVQGLDLDAGASEKIQASIRSGDEAFQTQKYAAAEEAYQEAVRIADQGPPTEDLVEALGRLGRAKGLRQNYAEADACFHRQLAVLEKLHGAESPATTEAYFNLAGSAAFLKDFVTAEKYASRAIELDEKTLGENSEMTAHALWEMAGLYEMENRFDKAAPFLERSVKATETMYGPEDSRVTVYLWGLCDLYGRLGDAEKEQACYHRTTTQEAKDLGELSPRLVPSLTKEAAALRKLGRNNEAAKIEERMAAIEKIAANQN